MLAHLKIDYNFKRFSTQPFWPEGTGCARGFLSAMDCGWLVSGQKQHHQHYHYQNLFCHYQKNDFALFCPFPDQRLDAWEEEPDQDAGGEGDDQVAIILQQHFHHHSHRRSILNQTTDGNLIQAFKEFSLDPKTRLEILPNYVSTYFQKYSRSGTR